MSLWLWDSLPHSTLPYLSLTHLNIRPQQPEQWQHNQRNLLLVQPDTIQTSTLGPHMFSHFTQCHTSSTLIRKPLSSLNGTAMSRASMTTPATVSLSSSKSSPGRPAQQSCLNHDKYYEHQHPSQFVMCSLAQVFCLLYNTLVLCLAYTYGAPKSFWDRDTQQPG